MPEIRRPRGQRLKLDDHARAVEERSELIADLRLELGGGQRSGLVGEDDPRSGLGAGFEIGLGEIDRRRLQSREPDGDGRRRDEREFDRGGACGLARKRADPARDAGKERADATASIAGHGRDNGPQPLRETYATAAISRRRSSDDMKAVALRRPPRRIGRKGLGQKVGAAVGELLERGLRLARGEPRKRLVDDRLPSFAR